MIEEVIIVALCYVLAGYISMASANKMQDSGLGRRGQFIHGLSRLLKVLILPLFPLDPHHYKHQTKCQQLALWFLNKIIMYITVSTEILGSTTVLNN